MRAGRAWRADGEGWTAIRAISAELAVSAHTGRTDAGWARRWLTGLDAFTPSLLEQFVVALAPIEDEGMDTAWFHGDLWPGNILLRRPPRPPVVIDWERARPDAPAGLDAVFAEVSRTVMTRRCAFGEAAAWLARSPSPELVATAVGGRPFSHWDRPQQLAVLLATVTHFVTGEEEGGSIDHWTKRWGEVNILPMMTALRAAVR
jgi:aminoglycoside phosphotransferase (APT) family kinase protein